MALAGRSYNAGNQYRYGFNGQEKSDELGAGLTTAIFWEYDSRTGPRWNVDPVVKVWESPYSTFGGNPISFSDPNGDVIKFEKGERVKSGEHLRVKIKVFLLRALSKTFRTMYRDLNDDKEDEYTIKSVIDPHGASYGAYRSESKTLEIKTRRFENQMNMNMKQFDITSLRKIGHELGHAWREKYNLDVPIDENFKKPDLSGILPVPPLKVSETPAETAKHSAIIAQNNSTRQLAYKTVAERTVSNEEQSEIGAMEIENLINRDLFKFAFYKRYAYVREAYGSKLVVQQTTDNNRTGWSTVRILIKNGGYNAFKNYPKDFFDKPHDLHKMYNIH